MGLAKESLLTKIQALLAMTEFRGCTKAESAVARAKALDLMKRHGITFQEVAQHIPTIFPSESVTAFDSSKDGPAGSRVFIPTTDAGSDVTFVAETFSRRLARRRKPLSPIVRIVSWASVCGLAIFIVGDISQLFAPTVMTLPGVATQVATTDLIKLPGKKANGSSAGISSLEPLQPGTYQKMYDGQWFKFEVGANGHVVGISDSAHSPWPNIPVWKD